jgi:tRNA 2-selenouridine synthase SelU
MSQTKEVNIEANPEIIEGINLDKPQVVEDEDLNKPHMNYDLVDREVAQYASETIIEIDEATNKRLKRLIDKRILTVMVFTYFIQALDKGTMSFASIMGIITDTHMSSAQVSH